MIDGDAISAVPRLTSQLYALVGELETPFPGRRLTPDGHLVGSLGEVIAAHPYGLKLLAHSTAGHDAVDEAGRRIEMKATQGKLAKQVFSMDRTSLAFRP